MPETRTNGPRTARDRTAQEVVARVGLLAGPALALLAFWLLPASVPGPEGPVQLAADARVTAAVAVLMACWWLTEAISLNATALLPLALLPMLGAVSIQDAAAPYASPVIFLFLGGFMLGLAMERWGLHRRIALLTILAVGSGPRSVIAGFMIATAMLSAFVSNTATVIMLVPIATSVLASLRTPEDAPAGTRQRFATCLLLAIAYAASIGGMATLIGTPPNAVLAGFVDSQEGISISFGRWVAWVLPLVAVMLPLAFWLLTGPLFRVRGATSAQGRPIIRRELHALGPMRSGEWVVMTIFFLTATLWMFGPWIETLRPVAALGLRFSDAQVAMLATIALFITPVDRGARRFAMDWQTASGAPFGILLLFGGGLSLAAAIQGTGLDRAIGQQFALLDGLPLWALVLAVCLLVTFLTELTSNTAVTTAMLPVLWAASPVLGVEPAYLLLPATLSASCAFMLPVATPPNAVVFATGSVPLPQMVRAGLVLNALKAVVITAWTLAVGSRVF